MPAVPASITDTLGEEVATLCPFNFGDRREVNHCAHYVSHVLDYHYAPTCKGMSTNKDAADHGATLRVNTLFNRSSTKGYLKGNVPPLGECLVYVTISANVAGRGRRLRMSNMSKKHVGIWYQNKVWNYSNNNDQVVADSLSAFRTKFDAVYATRRWRVVYLYGNLL